jgi:mono/diheme cytochrome c family protein
VRQALLAVVAGAAAVALPAAAAPVAGGAKVFQDNCAICHQAGGVGVAGQFPRLAGRVGVIAADPKGRDFLASLVLSGMSGTVVVDGQSIVGIMPGFDSLKDDDLAAVLTYVAQLEGPAPSKTKAAAFKARDIAAARAAPRASPGDMAARRADLAAAKVIP